MRRQLFGIVSGIVLIGLLAFMLLIGRGLQRGATMAAARLPVLAPPPTTVSTQTIRLDAPRTMTLDQRGQNADYAALTVTDVDGNLLTATTTDSDQGRAVLTIDLDTGAHTQLTDFDAPRLIHSLGISGEHVVWIEEASPDSPAALHIVNLPDRSEAQFSSDGFSQVDFQDGVVAWQGTVDEVGGLYGYDIDATQPFIIDKNAYAHLPKLPRVCNDEWLIYLLSPTGALPHLAELIAFNRVTDERISLGELPITIDPASAHQHACDGGLVVWAARRFEEIDGKAQSVNELHLFDLSTRRARVLDKDAPLASNVLIDGDIVLLLGFHNIGYDLINDVRFEANTTDLPNQGTGVPVMLTADQLVWIVDGETDDATKLYVTTVVRER